jgi:hypothetical protein
MAGPEGDRHLLRDAVVVDALDEELQQAYLLLGTSAS